MSESRSIMSDSLRPRGLYSPWNSPGQNIGAGSLSVLQRIFLTQESNRSLLHCWRIIYQLWGKAEGWGIDAFELWYWKTLESPLNARKYNQQILKKINPEYLLEGLFLQLKLQYFGHLMRRVTSLEKTLLLGNIEGRRRREQQKITGWHHQCKRHELG